MMTAKHFPGSISLGAGARGFRRDGARAMASACGTVKLTVAVTVIPSATQSSSTSRPAAVAGSLTAIFGRPGVETPGHGKHALAVAGAQRIHLRAHEAVAPVGRRMSAANFAAALVTAMRIRASAFASGGQVVRAARHRFRRPRWSRWVFKRHTGEDGIGGCADGAALETEI